MKLRCHDPQHELNATAWHEAGHVVAGWSMGYEVERATIVQEGNNLGSVQYARNRDLLTFAEAVTHSAGAVAEAIYCPMCAAESPVDNDVKERSLARAFIGRCDVTARERVRLYTERLITGNTIAVSAVASQLLAVGTMDADELLAAQQTLPLQSVDLSRTPVGESRSRHSQRARLTASGRA